MSSPVEELQLLKEILNNIEALYFWNLEFYHQLNILLDDGEDFGQLFIDMIPLLRQLYAQYNENYPLAMEAYEKLKKKRDFLQFIDSLQQKQGVVSAGVLGENAKVTNPSATKNFLSFLYLPIQRMIAYDSLLKELIDETPKDSSDYQNLSIALKTLREAEDHADKLANQRKNIDKVTEIQSRLVGSFTNLAQPHRRFVYEADAMLVFFLANNKYRLEERKLFLFNDIILCAKLKKNKGLKVDFVESWRTLRAEMVDKKDDTKELRHRFKLHSSAKERTFVSVDRAFLVQLITDQIKKHQYLLLHTNDDDDDYNYSADNENKSTTSDKNKNNSSNDNNVGDAKNKSDKNKSDEQSAEKETAKDNESSDDGGEQNSGKNEDNVNILHNDNNSNNNDHNYNNDDRDPSNKDNNKGNDNNGYNSGNKSTHNKNSISNSNEDNNNGGTNTGKNTKCTVHNEHVNKNGVSNTENNIVDNNCNDADNCNIGNDNSNNERQQNDSFVREQLKQRKRMKQIVQHGDYSPEELSKSDILSLLSMWSELDDKSLAENVRSLVCKMN
eukprot:CAMPEP_0174277402 /NCGR_PEP_ID=MMETSP0439-20130205/60912_1 /TAXON_ID=0 /ORGANISM="Stereomyxa ramosa, Strain Chinc5" /LENGTH=555 /DNA_ID=CAMNT_0015369717 /DNA_START=1824 /DNA_END=3491 /DNA_ORIENTATION=-